MNKKLYSDYKREKVKAFPNTIKSIRNWKKIETHLCGCKPDTPPDGMPTFGRHGINSRCSCLGPSIILSSNTRLLLQNQLEKEATGTRVYRELWGKQSRNVTWPFLPTSLLPSLIRNNLKIFPGFTRDPGISQYYEHPSSFPFGLDPSVSGSRCRHNSCHEEDSVGFCNVAFYSQEG